MKFAKETLHSKYTSTPLSEIMSRKNIVKKESEENNKLYNVLNPKGVFLE